MLTQYALLLRRQDTAKRTLRHLWICHTGLSKIP